MGEVFYVYVIFRHSTLIITVKVEALKVIKSATAWGVTGAMLAGIPLVVSAMMIAIAHNNPVILAKAGAAATHDGNGFFFVATQITAAAEILGFGTMIAWIYAREFMDNTAIGLAMLPMSRHITMTGKFLVYAAWTLITHLLLAIVMLLIAVGFRYGFPTGAHILRFLMLGAFTLLATPVIAWVSVCTRSLIAGCGTALALIILGQLGALLGANSGWIPPAVPALWALQIVPTTTPQLLVSWHIGGICQFLTYARWSRMQLAYPTSAPTLAKTETTWRLGPYAQTPVQFWPQ